MFTEGRLSPVLIILMYLIAHFFMMVNNGWYIDDWCVSTNEGLKSIFTGVGLPFMISIHQFLMGLSSEPALLYHVLTGVLEIAGILVFYRVLILLGINRTHVFVLTLLFALLPYNQAKITIVCFMYTVGFLFFLLGALFFMENEKNRNLVARISALVCYFLGYLFLPSTLVLSLAFILFILLRRRPLTGKLNISYAHTLFLSAWRYWDSILLPFIFWFFKAQYLKPTGIYAAQNYRDFTPSAFLTAPLNSILALVKNLAGLAAEVGNAFKISNLMAVAFLALLVVVVVFLRKLRMVRAEKEHFYLYAGIYFFLCAAFPYVMVRLVPEFDGFDTRHQVLLRLGTPALILYIVLLFRSERSQRLAIYGLTAVFILSNISWQLQHQKSWFKQEAMMRLMEDEQVLANGVNLSVVDNTVEYNEYKGPYVFYTYTGMMTKVFGDQKRFALNDRELNFFFKQHDSTEMKRDALNHMSQAQNIADIDYYLFIDYGGGRLENILNLKFLYWYYFNRPEFEFHIRQIISLRTVPFRD